MPDWFKRASVRRMGVCVVVGFLVIGAWMLGVRFGSLRPMQYQGPIREVGYQYISPLILCVANANVDDPELDGLHKRIQETVDKERDAKHVSRMSVFVGDLMKSRWTGVGADDLYAPASMLKIGTLMTYLHLADKDPSILEKRFKVTNGDQPDESEYYRSTPEVNPGDSFTVNELLENMIVRSSNASYEALSSALDLQHVEGLYRLLDIPLPGSEASQDFLSPRQYSGFLRALYNATYLSRSGSEKALSLLARSDFKEGLVAGLPPGTRIAHKFGERAFVPKNDLLNTSRRELHDCGVVYYPERPYLICVMTEGTSYPDMASAIAAVSSVVYDAARSF